MQIFKPSREQQLALDHIICRIENMSIKNRANHYDHFCRLASMAAEHLPAGQTMSIFDDFAALFYKEKSQDHDVYQQRSAK